MRARASNSTFALVVFAHKPPPLHGQSLMVKLMVEGLADATHGIRCYHVNSRLSADLGDVGKPRYTKVFRLLGYCAHSLWLRARRRADTLYFVPAAPMRASLYRDWVVMFLCRPFFRRTIYHWHAAGLGSWLQKHAKPWERRISHALMDRVDLALVPTRFSQADAELFGARKIEVVANGIPDPCPQFAAAILPRREARLAIRKKLLAGLEAGPQEHVQVGERPEPIRVLFLAHCTRDKGLFEAIDAVLLANEQLRARGLPLSFHLTVAGLFPDPLEKQQFEQLCRSVPGGRAICYAGFVQGQQKTCLLAEADLFCFPSHRESFGLVLVEAMAFGLPIVTANCGGVLEVLPPNYPGITETHSPEHIASALQKLAGFGDFAALRERFLSYFTLEKFVSGMASALHRLSPLRGETIRVTESS